MLASGEFSFRPDLSLQIPQVPAFCTTGPPALRKSPACDPDGAKPAPPRVEYANGANVLVFGLKSEAGSAFNGIRGFVGEWREGAGRYHVHLETGGTINVRPENLMEAESDGDSDEDDGEFRSEDEEDAKREEESKNEKGEDGDAAAATDDS